VKGCVFTKKLERRSWRSDPRLSNRTKAVCRSLWTYAPAPSCRIPAGEGSGAIVTRVAEL
jgi:hypothetical protein